MPCREIRVWIETTFLWSILLQLVECKPILKAPFMVPTQIISLIIFQLKIATSFTLQVVNMHQRQFFNLTAYSIHNVIYQLLQYGLILCLITPPCVSMAGSELLNINMKC